MVTSRIRELEALKEKTAILEKQVASELTKTLAALPAEYGFDSVESFLSAVRDAAGGRRGRKRGATKPSGGAPAGRRKRAKITDETKAQVKKLAGEGKTGAVIAKTVGISLPSVQNIKKELGLVVARKKK